MQPGIRTMRKWRCVSVWMVPYRLATKGWSTALKMRSSVSTRITWQTESTAQHHEPDWTGYERLHHIPRGSLRLMYS